MPGTNLSVEGETMKARNQEAILDVMLDLPLSTVQAFERDYKIACRDHPNELVRAVLRKGGRRYAAVGWRIAYEAVSGPKRLRRPPALAEIRLRELVSDYLQFQDESDRKFKPCHTAFERLNAFLGETESHVAMEA